MAILLIIAAVCIIGYLYFHNSADNHEASSKRNFSTSPSSTKIDSSTIKKESLDSIHDNLTQNQKECCVCLVVFFAGFANMSSPDLLMGLVQQMCTFVGLEFEHNTMERVLQKHQDPDELIDTILTIQHVKTKEFLILTCHDIVKQSGSYQAKDLLYKIAQDMDYNSSRVNTLIWQYS